jgi:chromosome segregation ATPase
LSFSPAAERTTAFLGGRRFAEFIMVLKSPQEVRDILAGEAFHAWLDQLGKARRAKRLAGQRADELKTQVHLLDFRSELAHTKAIDTLHEADSLEHEAAILGSEAAELDNTSFESVSGFEDMRKRCTALWQDMERLEVEAEAAAKAGKEAKAKDLSREREKVAKSYEAAVAEKDAIWKEVETLWRRNIEKGLALHEVKHKSTLVRNAANALFEEVEASERKAAELKSRLEETREEKAQAEESFEALMEEGRQTFDALLREDFLYWPSSLDNKEVYVTPLIENSGDYALDLVPGTLYRCDHRQGIEGLSRLTERTDSETQST